MNNFVKELIFLVQKYLKNYLGLVKLNYNLGLLNIFLTILKEKL